MRASTSTSGSSNVSGSEPLDLRHLGRARVIGCYLLETTDGPALFDCGPTSCVPELHERLHKRGLELRDVRHLLLSHIHLDHAGAAGTLVRQHPALQVHVSEIGAPHPVDPERRQPERFALIHFGVAADPERHLADLRERLERWTGWVEAGTSEDEFVAAAAQDLGPDSEVYEQAMPFWQSYAGLARYWKKKRGED